MRGAPLPVGTLCLNDGLIWLILSENVALMIRDDLDPDAEGQLSYTTMTRANFHSSWEFLEPEGDADAV